MWRRTEGGPADSHFIASYQKKNLRYKQKLFENTTKKNSKELALKADTMEPQDKTDHLVMRRFLKLINHSEIRLHPSRQNGDKDMKMAKKT